MSCENSGGSLFRKIAFQRLTRPVNLVLYWLSWRHLCSLCRYGRLYRNVPVLAACLLWWLGAIGYGLWLWGRYKKGRCPSVFHKLLPQERGLALALSGNGEGWTNTKLTQGVERCTAKEKGWGSGINGIDGTAGLTKENGTAERKAPESTAAAGETGAAASKEPAFSGTAQTAGPGETRTPGLTGAARAETPEIERFPETSVKWYVRRRHFCQFFLKDKRVVLLDLRELTREERDFLDVKLSSITFLGRGTWRAAAGIFLAAVTLYGGWGVAESAVPYQGKLAWFLDDLKDKRTCTLKHDNIYEWGIEGILEDVREKVNLPENLCLSTSFNLHFAPDGEIITLDTMLYGFDEEGDFVDSYLISYNRAHSGKMTIYLHGASSASYDESRALAPLVEGVGVLPLRETVEEWQREECYGILYYGKRQWYSSEGIRLLDRGGDWQLPPVDQHTFSGYSISVFCPENESLVPARYIYQ